MTLLPLPHGLAVEPLDAEIDRLRGLALRDELTGLANRRAFLERMQRASADALAGGPIFSLVLLDLDGLKDINDTLGYQAGDRALREFGAALAGAVRTRDLVARIGGDEFAVVAGHDSPEDAAAFYDRLRDLARGILRTVKPRSPAVILSAAVGQGIWGPPSLTVESVFTLAESELATAKASPPPGRLVDGAFRPRGRRVLGEELRSLLAMARHVNTAGAMTTLLHRATEQAAALIGAQIAGLFLVTEGRLVGDEVYRDGVWESYLEDRPLGRGVMGRTAVSGVPEVHNTLTPDLVHDPIVIDRYGLRTMLCVPLRDRRGATIGVLALCNKRGGQDFQESDVGLAQAYGDLAASAIENARDYAAMEEARAELLAAEAETRRRNQELEARNDVAAQLTGSQSVPAALSDVLPIIARVAEVDGALVMLVDDEGRLRIAAGFGVSETIGDVLDTTPPYLAEQVLGAAAAVRRPVIVADLAEEPAAHWPALRAIGVRSFAILPLVAGERTVGMLGAGSFTTNAFDDARLSRLRAFADQIAVWLDGRRLLEQATQSAQDARFLADIGEALNETRDEAAILRRLAQDMAARLDGGVIVVMRDADGGWQPAAVAHTDPRFEAEIRAAMGPRRWSLDETSRDLIGQYAGARLINLLSDSVPEDARWVHVSRAMGVQSLLVAPLTAGGQTLGVMVAGRHHRLSALTTSHLHLVQEVAQHAAVAIANARALQDAEQSRSFLRAVMEQAGDAILIFAADADCILDANVAAERLTGRTRAELLRCGMRHLAGTRGLRPWQRTVARLRDTHAGADRLVMRLRGPERDVTVEVSASHVATPAGAVVMAVLRDITDELTVRRRQARLLRREREQAQRSRLLLELAGRLARAESPAAVMRISLAACRRLAHVGRAGIFLWDAERHVFRFGAATGLSTAELATLQAATLDPASSPLVAALIESDTPLIATTPTGGSLVLDGIRRDLKVHAHVSFTLRAGGELLGALGADATDRRRPFSGRDLTMLTGIARQTAVALGAIVARRQAEEARDYLQTVMQNAGDGIVVTDRASGVILDANDPFCSLMDCARSDLVGQPVLALIRPDEREAAAANQAKIRARQFASKPTMRTLQRRDGEVVPTEVNVSFMTQGGRDLVVTVVRDMRARLESDARLRMFAQMVDSAGEGIGVISTDGVIVHANPAAHRILGYPPDTLIGVRFRSLLPEGASPDRLQAMLADALAGGWRGEVRIRRADGSSGMIRGTATPLRDDDGRVLGLVAVAEDVADEAADSTAGPSLPP